MQGGTKYEQDIFFFFINNIKKLKTTGFIMHFKCGLFSQ